MTQGSPGVSTGDTLEPEVCFVFFVCGVGISLGDHFGVCVVIFLSVWCQSGRLDCGPLGKATPSYRLYVFKTYTKLSFLMVFTFSEKVCVFRFSGSLLEVIRGAFWRLRRTFLCF